jgi:hypothetical protein
MVETWHLSISNAFYKFCSQHKYQILHLPAELTTGKGHNKGGIIVLFKRNLKLSAVLKERNIVGERISCVVADLFRFSVIYRRPEHQTA